MLSNRTICDGPNLERRSASRQIDTSPFGTANPGRASLLRATVLALGLSLGAFETLAQQPKPEIKLDVYSVERNTCGDWLSTSMSTQARHAHYFWFLGFVSGGNYAIPNDQIGTSKMLSETQFENHVTAQCKKNSTLTITTISLQFVDANVPSSNRPKSPTK